MHLAMHTSIRCWLSVIAAALFFTTGGCTRSLTDADVRRLAAGYRDEWLTKSGFATNSPWASTKIIEVQRSQGGWSVIFHASTGTEPEGMHFYSIEVQMTQRGELKKIVHGEAVS